MRNKFKQQKSSQISLRADCHSWRSGLGWQTLCGVNRSNISPSNNNLIESWLYLDLISIFYQAQKTHNQALFQQFLMKAC